MKLYFVRHGESEANLLNEFSNRGSKHGLTDKGRQQAHTLAQSLQTAPVAAIFSSPLLRARQTAEILSQTLGVPYRVTDALREFDCGVLEGKSDTDTAAIVAAPSQNGLVCLAWGEMPPGAHGIIITGVP